MSYDFYLFKPDRNLSLEEAAQKMISEEEEGSEINPGSIDLEKEERKHSLVAALQAKNSGLTSFPFDYQEISKRQSISVEEARVRYRHIELNDIKEEIGIQIILYDDTASITVPYWHTGKKVENVVQEIWSYVKIFHEEAEYVTYDSQIGKVLSLDSDFEKVLATYDYGADRTRETVSALQENSRRPWWKFW